MAQNQNSSPLNHIQSGHGDRTINNGQLLSHHSNSYPNYMNGSGHCFESTHLLDATSFGQQGFGGRMIELNTTRVGENKIQIQRFMNYEFPVENQPACLPSSDIISFSKVMNTSQFLSPASTMDRLLARSNIPIPCHPNSGYLLVSNQANYHRVAGSEPFSSICHHQNNPFTRETPTFSDLEENIDHQIATRVILNPKPINTVLASQVKGGSNPSPNPNSTFDLQGNQSHQISNMDEPDRKPVATSSAFNNQRRSQTNSSYSNDQDYDGRIHSRCKKYGPYRCPKCDKVFPTSQAFASHVRFHYKRESPAEKSKRLAAKRKRKNKFNLVHTDDGLTLVPIDQSVDEDHAP